WAELGAHRLRGTTAELTRMAYRIAESARFGGTRPLPMPFNMKGVPDGLAPSIMDVSPEGRVRASLSFIVGDSSVGMDVIESAGSPEVGDLELPAPNTRLGRYPAYVSANRLHVFGVKGFDVSVGVTGSLPSQLRTTGGLPEMFRRTTILGLDQSKWTTDPVN
ncbi:hypothetical protein ACFQ07_16935, partial [Actinomadura adrarensis]